jgi:hypothetical protein
MSVEMWPDPNNPKIEYPIGYEGLEHSSTGVLGFVADIFRATYPVLPITFLLEQ